MSESNTEARFACDDGNRKVRLISAEGESFEISLIDAKLSDLLNFAVTDGQDEEVIEIPLMKVKSAILAKVIEFIRHYNADPMTDVKKVYTNKLKI
jgi:S-phase kinase-associated protein 1